MACCRKGLTVGYNYLSRRFHPSFFHLVQEDRERSGAPQPLPLPLTATVPRAASYQSFDRFRFPDRDWRRLGFSLPIAIDRYSRNYSSSSDGSNEIGYINDVADVLTETTVDTSTVATAASASSVPLPFPGEVAAAAADSFVPVAALQHLIDAVHSFTGLNWWACIALTTLLIRGATVPLLINQLKASAKLNIMRPELEKIKEELNNNMDPEFLQEGQKRMKALFKKHGVTPFTPLKGALIQGPIFISFFFAISNMVEKVPSFKGGGAFWFTDLTTPDPMYIFPVLTSLTFLATVELNMQEGMEGNHMANTMKNFSRVLALLTVPFTASFPKAIFCYWVTSNLFSLLYGFALKRPPVRKFLDLPEAVPKLELASQPNFSFFGTSKPVLPTASPTQEIESTPAKTPERRVSSSAAISQRIKNLEKNVKARNKYQKR
ncbi:mitochondrial inner membrane protein OXA1-like [Dendrobium catenatum]|uniref:Mitochondrial inner membrane protein OXA1-like n=1 Tax=Dendrobium catenatum TaxID=906689 RepID=A0A2I0X831_9ASPA|nr:mitochondrial inner membrane protein OXA1-like [Dendrobium catenatum]PKU84075.1 Mitochondrial inner membrane protein OXA1-like [Dendrobium catenatum]